MNSLTLTLLYPKTLTRYYMRVEKTISVMRMKKMSMAW